VKKVGKEKVDYVRMNKANECTSHCSFYSPTTNKTTNNKQTTFLFCGEKKEKERPEFSIKN
jgi:hypothetical protein